MIHVQLDGIGFPTDLGLLVRNEQYTVADAGIIVTPSPAPVGVAAVNLFNSNSSKNQCFMFRNMSTAGQRIGIGSSAMTGINDAEIVLDPGEGTPVFFDHGTSVYAISDLADGTLYFWFRETDHP